MQDSRPLFINSFLTGTCALLVALITPGGLAQAQQPDLSTIKVARVLDKPIIGPDIHPSIGVNIQGPSLIRVPDWVENPLGKYYLYFADHKGLYIRLAYAAISPAPGRYMSLEAYALKIPTLPLLALRFPKQNWQRWLNADVPVGLAPHTIWLLS